MPPRADRHPEQMIEAAAAAFSAATGLAARSAKAPARGGHDGAIEFRVGTARFKRRVIVREIVDRYSALSAIDTLDGAKSALVTTHLSPNMIQACREMQVDALDLAGNASLVEDNCVVIVSGRPRVAGSQARRSKTWTKSTLRVALALLVSPSLLERSYRDIAQRAGVSHGTVQNAVRALVDHRDVFERPDARGLQFADRERLIDEWVTLYPRQLRESLVLGRYRADSNDWWRDAPDLPGQCQFGGEPAAAILTDYLKPARVTAYCTETVPREWVMQARLRPDPAGNVEFLRAPVKLAPVEGLPPNVVEPLLVYADLVASGDPRNIEAAGMLRERYLAA
ncbi:type IV toxin-antitoxin system AbiEi family antitoxin [Caballeronia sp. LZ034LL]|uniref:type IV toxin-antitoxin system AbiEi family antitoxin n=1 Tax=Caballeronia sp. LZ034LL TaxID=3038567 RepID=UPI00285CC305|nr:type IV toxin-antitoxin system AbiEi family antitoxin [Caballeronia sp. LZ034LL]MDR5836682.1 type IV toxin-antitoxin system AbiEi family antitoxin [Caballeronia sp. LZ034LL]